MSGSCLLRSPSWPCSRRVRLPSRSALSRFLASLTWEATEALRPLFLADLLARPLDKERHTGKLADRAGNERVVFDIDGTREAARQRARPQTEELPAPQRRLNQVCAAFLHGAQARGGRPFGGVDFCTQGNAPERASSQSKTTSVQHGCRFFT